VLLSGGNTNLLARKLQTLGVFPPPYELAHCRRQGGNEREKLVASRRNHEKQIMKTAELSYFPKLLPNPPREKENQILLLA